MTDPRARSAAKPYTTYHASRRPRRLRPEEAALDFAAADERRPPPPDQAPLDHRRRLRGWRLALLVSGGVFLVVIVAAVLWGFFAWRTVDKAVAKANGRITAATREALDPDTGSLLSHPTNILILGVDKRAHDPGRSDSIMLLRSNPKARSFSQLSIARDMRVDIPGHGMGKINTGYFWGGPALAIRTVRQFTGTPVNHVVVVSFQGFSKVIDAVGGVDIRVPRTITSWYSGGQTITFKKGWNHMNGKRAMIYARIRKADNDFYRQARQQEVLQALQTKLTRFTNLPRLPSVTAAMMKGVSTDLTTKQLAELAWRKWRADTTNRYILKGAPAMIGGQSYVISDRTANLRLIERFMSN